jgi:hypothetical protein
MKKRIIWLSLALAAGQAGHAFAQGASDALRYSRLQFGGPARTLGIAGANVALGADFGNLSSNPAGLGMYQKSEAHFSPGLGLGQGQGRIEGSPAAAVSADKNSFHIASTGLVLTSRRADDDQRTNWRGGAFALGFTRQADFNTASNYQGQLNNNQSYLSRLQPDADAFRGQAPGVFQTLDKQADDKLYRTDLGLAYGAFLANIVSARRGTRADSAVVLRQQGSVINQGEIITNSGSASQFDLGYGASYRDRLYIGGAIGFVSSNFRQSRTLTEGDTDANTHFINLVNQVDMTTDGSGFNARLGLIYRATDYVRVGASVQTPTFMRMTRVYDESLTSNFSAQGTDVVPSDLPVGKTTVAFPTDEYAYTITTPFRASGGAAVTLGKNGFISGDVEYVNYGQARLNNDSQDALGDNYAFTEENADIRARYQSAVNLRVGGEYRYDVFRARLGFARYGDPYKLAAQRQSSQNFYTAGIGLRQNSFFLDIAGVYHTYTQAYTPYTLANALEPVIKVNGSRYTTTVTAGITF